MDTIQSHFQAILDLCTEREKNYQLEIHKLTKEIEELQKVPMSKILSKEISELRIQNEALRKRLDKIYGDDISTASVPVQKSNHSSRREAVAIQPPT